MAGLGEFRTEQLDDVSVVTLRGEHDFATARRLYDELDALLVSGRSVVVDLSEAAFIDSSILRVIYNATAAASRADLVVAVLAPAATMSRKLFDLVGLSGVIPVLDTRDAAIAYAMGSGETG